MVHHSIEEHLDISTNAAVRVPDNRWGDICSEGRQLWFKMSDKDRAALLGVQPPPPGGTKPTPRKVSLHDISAQTFLDMYHSFQDGAAATTQTGPTIDINAHEAGTVEVDNTNTTPASSNDQKIAPADLRRMLAPPSM